MTKEALKQKTLEIIEQMHQRYMEQAVAVIDNISDDRIAEFEDNYFAPKAFYDALVSMNKEKVTQASYTQAFVRRYNKAIRMFDHDIVYNR